MKKVEKKSKPNLNYKSIAIVVAAVIILIIIITFLVKLLSKNDSELKLEGFEKIAVYSYLEDNLLDVSTLYNMSGNSDYNELQIFQSKLKQALDTYFSNHSESEISTSIALGLVESKYIPDNVDFHGILVSDYTYNPESETLKKSPGSNSNISGIEAEINSIDYSDKKASVQKIEKISDDKYKVYFNIVNSMIEEPITEATGESTLLIKDNILSIDSCSIND